MDFAIGYRNNHRHPHHGNPNHHQHGNPRHHQQRGNPRHEHNNPRHQNQLQSAPRLQPQAPICYFYQRGICRFGERCRNLHSQPAVVNNMKDPEVETAAVSNASSSQDVSNTNSPMLSSSKSGPSTSSNPSVTYSETATKSCGICYDTIVEKTERKDQMFGILPNCNHCYCFKCIIKWRQSKEFDSDVSRACPECRKPSDYVYPSRIWFHIQETKDNFITKQKNRMQGIDCRYFRKGHSSCPFGNKCLYLHALPDGTKLDVGPPKARRNRGGHDNNDMLYQILYWLNDEDLDFEDEDDDDDDMVDELDLDDPEIAMQMFDHDDIRRYIAMERLMNGSDTESDDMDFMFLD
ncbi:unnamed protein product [Ceutorhynchus assimilis]|uniref:RING-type E3 ubiquitin transferase n=1 Tax=Ceutorhynchus assimilis TaxID=467358 RepID=A0A9N9QMH1_9CUCU|nr:unnamed protein product [Ceutorhynchus assimilis]